jgi:hypothetical protein
MCWLLGDWGILKPYLWRCRFAAFGTRWVLHCCLDDAQLRSKLPRDEVFFNQPCKVYMHQTVFPVSNGPGCHPILGLIHVEVRPLTETGGDASGGDPGLFVIIHANLKLGIHA